MKKRRVVITGIGPLASTGIGKAAFWEGLLEERVGIGLKEFKLNRELWEKFDFTKFNYSKANFNILKQQR